MTDILVIAASLFLPGLLVVISSFWSLSGMSKVDLVPQGEVTLPDAPSSTTMMFQRERDFAQARRRR